MKSSKSKVLCIAMSSAVYVCELAQDVQSYASDVLNETEENRKTGLEQLKEWAAENPLLNIRVEEIHLLPFLRVSKFDVIKAKQKLRNFYTMRRDIPEWFENRDPKSPGIQKLAKMGSFVISKKTFDNQMVVFIRPNIHDPKIHHLDEVIKTGLMILDIAVMEEELAQIYGVIAIIDMVNLSFGHLRHLTPNRIKNLVNAWQNFHCRPQRIEFVNASPYINVVLDIFKNFMSAKLRKRTHVCYDGFSSVTKYFHKEFLPIEYGGEKGSLGELGEYWSEKLISYSEWFSDDEKYKAVKLSTRSRNLFSNFLKIT